MENINIAAGERTPEVAFDFEENRFALRGESYPEDVSAFFGPVIAKLEEAASDGNTVHIRWLYEEDDENMQELGEEFGEDLEHAQFELKALPE